MAIDVTINVNKINVRKEIFMEGVLRTQRSLAYTKGGFRERYAMDKGTEKIVEFGGHQCLRYDYDHNDPYQDANGAMWDMERAKWIY